MADAGERKLTGTFHILIIEEFTFVWLRRMAASIEGDVLVWGPSGPFSGPTNALASEAKKGHNQNRYCTE
jgi:hypothetical protein